MIERILEIALKIRSPLALSGFIAAIFFLIARQMVSKMPKPKQEAGYKILRLTLVFLFVLSLTAMLLGFAGYVIEGLPRGSATIPKPTLHTITGVLRENGLQEAPIAGALVTIDEKKVSARTEADGTFSFTLNVRSDESLLIHASASGFVTKTKWVRPGEFVNLLMDREH